MRTLIFRLWNDDNGFVISAELVLVLTIAVLGMVVGLHSVTSSVNNEFNDLSGAFGSLNQSYYFRGFAKSWHAAVSGSAYGDRGDFCDCSPVIQSAVGAYSHGSGAGANVGGEGFVSPQTHGTGCPNGDCGHVTPCVNGDCLDAVPCDDCQQPTTDDPATENGTVDLPMPDGLNEPSANETK